MSGGDEQARAAIAQQPALTVRLMSFPESNGKRNWTAMIVRVDEWDGLIGNCGGMTVGRGEFWNRVAYEAECARCLLGERDTQPHILDYGDDIKTPEEWKGEVIGGRPVKKRAAIAQPAEPADAPKRWPFVESPGEFTSRLHKHWAEFGSLLPAVRHVLIEDPPTFAVQADAQPVAWAWKHTKNGGEGVYWQHPSTYGIDMANPLYEWMPLYAAAPPAPQPAADAQPVAPTHGLLSRLQSLKVLLGTDSPEVRGWAPVVQQGAQATVNAAIAELKRITQEGEPQADAQPLAPGGTWEDNATRLLERCPHTVWQRPGAGPVDLLASLVVTFMGMQQKLAAAPPARQPLTDEQILECVRSLGLITPMGLTRDRGPYEVTEPTHYLCQLVRAIERAHGIGREGE